MLKLAHYICGALAALVAAVVLIGATPASAQKPAQCSGLGSVPMDLAMKDLDGNAIRLSSMEGRAFVVTVWSTFDKNSLQAVPLLKDLQEDFKQEGLVVLALSGDDSPSSLAKFRQEHAINYRLALPGDDPRLRQVYGPKGVGHLTLLLPDGRVCGEYEPPLGRQLAADVLALLGKKSAR